MKIEKSKEYNKKLKKFNKYKLLINNNEYLLYLINRYSVKKELPSDIIQLYDQHKKIFEESLDDLDEYLKEQKKLNTNNLVNTIDNISKNFGELNKDGEYDLKTVLSELRILNYLNDENYLILLSKYSKVVDELKYLNYYEIKLTKFKTPTPEIINILGNLYFNIIKSNTEENQIESNLETSVEKYKTLRKNKQISKKNTANNSNNYVNSIFNSIFSTKNKIIKE